MERIVKIVIVYPLAFPDGKVYEHFMVSVMNILDPVKYAIAASLGDLRLNIAQSQNCRFPVDANRNEHVASVLDNMNPDYIIFLDADMTHPPNVILRLLAQQKDIVGGLYHYAGGKFPPVALVKDGTLNDKQEYRHVSLYDDEPFEVDATGMGCILIKADVFRKLPPPWFEYQIHEQSGLRSISEDMKFCESARAAGYEIWIDPTVKCGHIKTVIVTEQHYLPYRNAVEKRLEQLKQTDRTQYEQLAAQIIDKRRSSSEWDKSAN